MKFLISFFVWILVLTIEPTAILPISEATTVDQPQPANIRIDHDILAENQPLRWTMLDVLRGTGIPAGVAEITGCADLSRAHLRLKQGTSVHEAMDALVAANPSYQWRLEGGVVNLTPRAGVPILDTRIANFQMDATGREIALFFQDLLRLPEVRAREAALSLKQGYWSGGPGAADEHPVPKQLVPVRITVQNLSLREAFNKIVLVSGRTIWTYHETDCNGSRTYIVGVASD